MAITLDEHLAEAEKNQHTDAGAFYFLAVALVVAIRRENDEAAIRKAWTALQVVFEQGRLSRPNPAVGKIIDALLKP